MGYPRPQFRRRGWQTLDGRWDFALDPNAEHAKAEQVEWSGHIEVPFAPETLRSGVADTALYRACWYRRTFQVSNASDTERWVLHFGAVDYRATVWVDETLVATHEGGYTPFEADITDALKADRTDHTIVVWAEDDPGDLSKPRGKQDWQLEPHSIWYPRTTGIWQSVWLEKTPVMRVHSLQWTANLERWEIAVDATVEGPLEEKLYLRVRLKALDLILSN
ncbi:MAG: sugar-binding domain-containing protein, partial [Polyangiaceae bacterium]